MEVEREIERLCLNWVKEDTLVLPLPEGGSVLPQEGWVGWNEKLLYERQHRKWLPVTLRWPVRSETPIPDLKELHYKVTNWNRWRDRTQKTWGKKGKIPKKCTNILHKESDEGVPSWKSFRSRGAGKLRPQGTSGGATESVLYPGPADFTFMRHASPSVLRVHLLFIL